MRLTGPALPLLLIACGSPDLRDELPFEMVEGEPLYTVLMPDGIPAIDAPEFVAAAEADRFLKPDETIVGVVGADGTPKAYSTWQLDAHEIVNDQLDGSAIAVTW